VPIDAPPTAPLRRSTRDLPGSSSPEHSCIVCTDYAGKALQALLTDDRAIIPAMVNRPAARCQARCLPSRHGEVGPHGYAHAVAETLYASCGDLSLAYQVFGDGPVELVFVGPFVSHVELSWAMPEFKAFFDQLARFSRVLVFDKAGLGLSEAVMARRTPWILRGMARLAPASGRSSTRWATSAGKA
jgi:hypothetical protein